MIRMQENRLHKIEKKREKLLHRFKIEPVQEFCSFLVALLFTLEIDRQRHYTYSLPFMRSTYLQALVAATAPSETAVVSC